MVREISRKVDHLEAVIKKYKAELDTLEDDYNFQRRQLEEAAFDLDDLNRSLNDYYEETYEEVAADLRQQEEDTSEAFMVLNNLIAEYMDATELSYQKERQHLDDKQEELFQAYQKERIGTEDAIDDCLAQRKRLLAF
ncbi:hypothetical protein [Streptococcus macacae]|uniref:Uncharacterized protein n=1 Tax=Streptococcus macacae NCTC 11558 TaxID=764298 RepID=G5JV93_9STRE|nr:hypothetical protein [Streptococcus macacae]EHJ52358.1 hypothetical protein STRMA_1805 [Streptococcus macacae NCTC 11558]SUN77719.1 Uncharacterised protein [Streptococcus macacae NCTC 11558]